VKQRNTRNRKHWAFFRRLRPDYLVPESTLREVYDRKVAKVNRRAAKEAS